MCLSEPLRLLPIAFALFVAQYMPIVLWEERVLSAQFGAESAAYCRTVPQRIPCRRPAMREGSAGSYNRRGALWSERSTLVTLVVLVV